MSPTLRSRTPFDDGTALTLEYSIDATVAKMPGRDVHAWRELVTPTISRWPEIVESILRPLRSFPEHPLIMARFGLHALQPAAKLARSHFKDEHMRALFAGLAAHSVLPLTQVASSATGLILAAAAHTTGWPIAAGGAQSLTNALVAHLESLGGRVVTGMSVTTLGELPAADATFFDTSLDGMTRIAGNALSESYRKQLESFQRGSGIFKMDWALSEPIPWKAKGCSRAGTVHLGGSLAEIERSEYAAFNGGDCEKPFTLVVQPSLFDTTRAPEGKHTAWAYCHVPNGSSIDRTELVERQMERFAPGFRDVVLARRASCSADLAAWNPNLAGGDISGGAMTLGQMLSRPTSMLYRTSNPALYLCSSSTPPGGGVHGMCGHQAALAAWKTLG